HRAARAAAREVRIVVGLHHLHHAAIAAVAERPALRAGAERAAGAHRVAGAVGAIAPGAAGEDQVVVAGGGVVPDGRVLADVALPRPGAAVAGHQLHLRRRQRALPVVADLGAFDVRADAAAVLLPERVVRAVVVAEEERVDVVLAHGRGLNRESLEGPRAVGR